MDMSTSDLSDELGEQVRILPPALRHFGGIRRFSGVVETIRCFEDNSQLRELAGTAGAGRILLVDGGGSLRMALFGDMIAQNALDHGWAGVVIHGAIRDVATLANMELGVMALGSSPRRSLKNGEGSAGSVLTIEGVRCAPGDLLVADDDGAVLLDATLAPPYV